MSMGEAAGTFSFSDCTAKQLQLETNATAWCPYGSLHCCGLVQYANGIQCVSVVRE